MDGIEYLDYKRPKSISVSSGDNGGAAWKHCARKVPFLIICTETNPPTAAYKDRKVTITSEGKIKKMIRQIDQISFP